MTLPSIIRIFFALDLQADVKEKLGEFISTLKKSAKTNAIRWTTPDNLHITLQFLAEVRTEHLSLLLQNVRQQLTGVIQQSEAHLGIMQLFPNPYRPRVIVLTIEPQDLLAKLANAIGQGIKETSYEIEERPFRGHLTLGRIKYAQGINLNFLSELTIPTLSPIHVKEVVLFRSEPVDHGSKYTVLDRIELTTGTVKAKIA